MTAPAMPQSQDRAAVQRAAAHETAGDQHRRAVAGTNEPMITGDSAMVSRAGERDPPNPGWQFP